MNRRKNILLTLITTVLALFASCSLEKEYGSEFTGDFNEVLFQVSVPENQNPGTRALTESDEYEIVTLDVISFDNATGQIFSHSTHSGTPVINGRNLDFVVKLEKDDDISSYDFIILANSSEVINMFLYSGNSLSKGLKKEVIQQILMESVTPGTGWIASKSDSRYKAMPMWGEVNNQTIEANKTYPRTSLLRSTVKIDLAVQLDNSSNTFLLEEVWYYNYYPIGYIIPSETNLVNNGRVYEPTLEGLTPTAFPIDYSADISADRKSLNYAIYGFEGPQGSLNDPDYKDNPCLVIKGSFNGISGWYRLDFSNTDPSTLVTTHIPLLRNHWYRVLITAINGRGYPDKDSALNSKPVNVTTDVIVWDQNDMDEVWVDGQYYYSVSPPVSIFWGESSTDNVIKVKTDYPTWSYELSDKEEPKDPSANKSNVTWVKVRSHVEGQLVTGLGTESLVVYDIEQNTAGKQRTAYMHITAGRFTMTSKITQYGWHLDEMTVSPSGDIPSAGEERTVTFSGSFDNIDIRAWDLTNDMFITESTIPTNVSGGGDKSATLSIPPHSLSKDRSISFEYFNSQIQAWRPIEIHRQLGINFNVISSVGTTVLRSGSSHEIIVSGSWPALQFRVIDTDTKGSVGTLTTTTLAAGSGTNTGVKATINPNNTWTEREVSIQYSVDGVNWLDVFSGTGTQSCYNVNVTYSSIANNATIAGEASECTVNVSGDFPKLWFRAAVGNTTLSDTPYVNAGSSGSVTLKIPMNTGGTRVLILQHSTNSSFSERLTTFRSNISQPNGYNYTVSMVSSADIPWNGGDVAFNITGNYSSVRVRSTLTDSQNATDYVTATKTFQSTDPTGVITIGQHTDSKSRNIYFWYENNVGVWTRIGSVTQEGKPTNAVLVVDGIEIVVARQDVSSQKNYWHYNMGILERFKTELYNGGKEYTKGLTGTGCKSYSEEGYPAGRWRVPTHNELKAIQQELHLNNNYPDGTERLQEQIGYHSSDELDAQKIYIMVPYITQNVTAGKGLYLARCVRTK